MIESVYLKQLTQEYPEILTPENILIIGITQAPSSGLIKSTQYKALSTQAYYLVFYYDVHAILDRFIQLNDDVKYMQYGDFYELKEIGSGGYGTVYTAKYKKYSITMPQTVVLKRFKSFDETPELFISEVSNNWQH